MLPGSLQAHKGPILLLANFDGTWPGLVSLLNHAATLDRLGVKNSRLWSQTFSDDPLFMQRLAAWCAKGRSPMPNPTWPGVKPSNCRRRL